MGARSWLFVPATRPDRFERATSAGADRVIVDLEDSVAPAEKEEARRAVAAWLAPERSVFVRINGHDSPWFGADLQAVCRPGLAGIMLPKAVDVAAIRHVAQALAPLPEATIVPLIETARGVWRARRLAGAAARVERLALGTLDLALDLDLTAGPDERELLLARSQLVLASRVAGREPPLDGVTAALDDPGALTSACEAARRLGFGGKLAIHPRQVPAINAAFAPTAEEVAWAERVVAAAHAGTGVTRVDGMMVDRPVVERARRLLRAVRP